MGDPKRIRKKYQTPSHPWQKVRIEEEKEIIKQYALKNKKEIWKMNSLLKSYKDQAKKLASLRSAQAEKETELFLKKLTRYGILKEGDQLDAVLVLKLTDILDRRLQTVVTKKGLAKSMKQSRQFITHRHVQLNNSIVTSPSHLVTPADEANVTFCARSALNSAEHPERQIKVEKKE